MKELVITKEDTKKLSLLFSHLTNGKIQVLLYLNAVGGTATIRNILSKIPRATEQTIEFLEKWNLIEKKGKKSVVLTPLGKMTAKSCLNILEVMKNLKEGRSLP